MRIILLVGNTAVEMKKWLTFVAIPESESWLKDRMMTDDELSGREGVMPGVVQIMS